MRNIVTLIFLFLISVSHLHAQFSCGTPVGISDGYSASGITTSGSGGVEDWITSATTCTISSSYFTSSDVYLFSYTTVVADENITMNVTSNNSWTALMAFERLS